MATTKALELGQFGSKVNVHNENITLDGNVHGQYAGFDSDFDIAIAGKTTSNLAEGSNLYYTDARTDARVALVVDSAPSALNTLNELAAALGDDANFSTTVTNSIAAKLPLAGGTITGNVTFGDNNKAIFGAGSDLQIYHDGSHSRITDAGTGSLLIDGDEVYVRSSTGENKIIADTNGGVNLFYDNASKLATTSTGVDVTGTVTSDGLTVDGSTSTFKNTSASPLTLISGLVGDKEALVFQRDGGAVSGSIEYQQGPLGFNIGTDTGHDFRFKTGGTQRLNISNGGDISFYEDTGANAKFFWDASTERLGIGTTSPAETLHVGTGNFRIDTDTNSTFKIADAGTNAIALYGGTGDELYMGANNAYSLRFKTDGNIVMDNGGNLGIGAASPEQNLHIKRASGSDTGGQGHILLDVADDGGPAYALRIGDTADDGDFHIDRRHSSTWSSSLSIDRATGNVGIGVTSPQDKLHISGASENIRLHNTGSGNYGLEIWRGSNKGASIAWGEGNANLEIKNYRNDSQPDGPYANIDFFTGGTNATNPNYNPDLRMRIQQTGEVGIGTSNPTAKLHVEGTIYANNGHQVKSVTTVGTGLGEVRHRYFRHISTGVGNETFKLIRYARHWWGTGWFQIIIRGTYYGSNSKYGVFTVNGHTRNGLASVQSHINNVGTATPYADNYNSTHEACDISITLPQYEQYNIEYNILASSPQTAEANVGHHLGNSNAFFLFGNVKEFI